MQSEGDKKTPKWTRDYKRFYVDIGVENLKKSGVFKYINTDSKLSTKYKGFVFSENSAADADVRQLGRGQVEKDKYVRLYEETL